MAETLEHLLTRMAPYEQWARKLVADAPPLSDETKEKLARLLNDNE